MGRALVQEAEMPPASSASLIKEYVAFAAEFLVLREFSARSRFGKIGSHTFLYEPIPIVCPRNRSFTF